MSSLNAEKLAQAKSLGFSDRQIAHLTGTTEDAIRAERKRIGLVPSYRLVDTCAAEFEAYTPYYYSTYDRGDDEVRVSDTRKIMILGGGPNRIGQGIEFDYCCVHAAFALKEDQCGFIGDGSPAYGNITGVIPRLLAVDATISNIAGLAVASGNGYANSYISIVLSDFNRLVSLLPDYADVPGQTKFYCSKLFWGSVMQRVATAGGGNRVAEIENTPLRKSLLGYEVVVSQVMPKAPAVNQICCLFGNLALAARLGDRRQTTIQMSEHALNAFEQDEVVIRGTERFDIVVHDVGDNRTTPKDSTIGAVAGPIVGLITGAS